MKWVSTALGAALIIGVPAAAQGQSMAGMEMPGMTMAAPQKPKKRAAGVSATKAPPAKPSADTTPSMDHDSMPGMDMSAETPAAASTPSMPGMAMPGTASAVDGGAEAGTAFPAGDAPAPVPPTDHYASRIYPAAEIDRAHRIMMREQGGQNFSQVLFNLAEYQVRRGGNGYRWDGEAWFGGDINRLALKTEGEGAVGGGIDTAEIQALYSRLVGPYFSLQAGVRHDLQPSPTRTYATVGFEGLAPYMFEVGGALFLSEKGDLLGRLEGYYDERITQRLILQPRVELNFAAQNVPENRIGAGLSNAELGLRLRYEIRREFAPYIGVSWDRKFGDTARFYRASGERSSAPSFVAGIRFWF